MRVVVVVGDRDASDWLAQVLGAAGISVAVLPSADATSPELRGADLLVVDADSAAVLDDAGPKRRVLLAARGGTVDLGVVEGRFADVIALPCPPDEAIERVRHAMRT